MLKRLIVFLICFVFVFSLVACQEQLKEEESVSSEVESNDSSNASQESSEVSAITEESSEPEESSQPEESSEASQETPEVSETPNVPEPPKQPATPAWKKAYLDLIEQNKEEPMTYALVYIDNDDIPELYVGGYFEMAGDDVYSYKNGSLIKQHLDRNDGGSYIPRSGVFCNVNGNMGYFYTNVYKLDNTGFSRTFGAYEEMDFVQTENGDYEEVYEYKVNGNVVSKTEYTNAIEAAFNVSNAMSLFGNEVMYDAIKQQIAAHK